MLKTKNSTYKAILILSLICIVAGLVLSALSITGNDSNLPQQIACLFNIAALIYAAYYILAGYSKDAAKYYKTYAAIFALAQIASLGAIGANSSSYLATVLGALTLATILVLLFSKDLGKKKSLSLCIALLVLVALSFCSSLAAVGWSSAFMFPIIVSFVLACILTVMTVAKYVDKAARGRT